MANQPVGVQVAAIPPGTDPQLVVIIQPLMDAILNLSAQVVARTGITTTVVISGTTLVIENGLITNVY